MNFGLEAHPAEKHRLRWSLFASRDYFAATGDGARRSFTSGWTNLATSATWSWVRDDRLASDVTAYYSRYDATRTTSSVNSAVTTNQIGAAGVRTTVTYRGERAGVRAGTVLEGAPVKLWGDDVGGYMTGDMSASYAHASAFAEFEGQLGPLRLGPGVRGGTERHAGRTFLEPRLSIRYKARRFAISASVDRTYQFLSVLRDANSPTPGAPMWFVHGNEHPVSSADGASVSLDAWRGENWTGSIAGWARRFRNVPHWRPVRSRNAASMEFQDGRAHGVDAMVQRHAGRFRGWISYQWARTVLVHADGREHAPQWDRRHEFDGLLAAGLTANLELAARVTVGSGGPFYYPAGQYSILRFKSDWPPSGVPHALEEVTVWSDVQGRLPVYTRFDVSARYAFRWGSWDIVPYLSVVNVAARKNALRYQFAGLDNASIDPLAERPYVMHRDWQMPIGPSIGIDFRF